LNLAEFFDGLRIAGMAFELSEAMSSSETGAGEILTAIRGIQLWQGQVTLSADRLLDIEGVHAKVDLLRRPGASFWLSHPLRRAPKADPGGVLFGPATITVKTRVSSREMLLQGGPMGGVISAGDHLSVSFGVASRAYFRVVTGATFAASTEAVIEVSPDIPAGIITGSAVQFVPPSLKAIIRPGSYSGSSIRLPDIADEISFGWVQTLG
jgi:hypothetical protein